MTDIQHALHRTHQQFWGGEDHGLMLVSYGVEVPLFGISYAVTPYERPETRARCHSLCYLREGTGRIRIAETLYAVRAGDVVLFPRDQAMGIYPDPDSAWEWYWIIIGGAAIDDMVREAGWLERPFPLAQNRHLSFPEIVQTMLQVMHLQPGGSIIIDGLLLQLLGQLLQGEAQSPNTVPTHEERRFVTEVHSFMGRNLQAPLTLHVIAEHFCLSSSQLSKLFRRATGVSPMQFLSYLRIETAKRLLQSTMSIRQIAEAVGYVEMVSFDRAFKRLTGVTPRQYREQSTR